MIRFLTQPPQPVLQLQATVSKLHQAAALGPSSAWTLLATRGSGPNQFPDHQFCPQAFIRGAVVTNY